MTSDAATDAGPRGEIYDIAIGTEEIALATFNGVIFGRIEGIDGKAESLPSRWTTTQVYAPGKLISQVIYCENHTYVYGEYSVPGLTLINQVSGASMKIEDH